MLPVAASTSSPEFFEAKYRTASDPWNFAHDSYELSRYAAILRVLSDRQHQRAFEPACSVGVLTRQLADICRSVEAVDFSASAVAQAKQRCAKHANVTVLCASLEERLPLVNCDLVVLSEVGYYFEASRWREIVTRIVEPLHAGATVLAAHWLGHSPDHRMSGDEVHAILREEPQLKLEHEDRHAGFRLDRWLRV